jgi:hypothetical protein
MQDTTPSPDKTYTVAEAAAIIGVDLATISRWLRPGKKQKLKAGWSGNERTIPAEQVDRLAAQRAVRTQAASVGQQLGTIAHALFKMHRQQWAAEFTAACEAFVAAAAALGPLNDTNHDAWMARAAHVGAAWDRRLEYATMRVLSLSLAREVRKLTRQPNDVMAAEEETVDA